MKRKVIQLAGNTLVVSLPKKWTNKQSIKKGDEIDIDERGNSLIVKTEVHQAIKKKSIDIRGLNQRAVIHLISAAHHNGVDEIAIKYDQKQSVEIIKTLLREAFIGFIIAKEEKHEIILKSIASSNLEEFDATLRRAFLVTISLSESCIQSIEEKKLASLKEIAEIEKTNNQLVLFCQRVIVKHGVKGNADIFLYIIPYNLNRIGDSYRDICQYLSKNQPLLSKETIDFFKRVNKQFFDYYTLFYQYTPQRLNEVSKARDFLTEDGMKLLQKVKKEEAIIIMNLLEIIRRVSSMLTSTIVLRESD